MKTVAPLAFLNAKIINALAASLPRSGPAGLLHLLIGVVALVVIGYAIFLARHTLPHAGGSAASGYCNKVRLLAQQDWPVKAALFPYAQPVGLEKIGGHWTKFTLVGQVAFGQRHP